MDEKGERRNPGDLGSGPGRPKQGRVIWVGAGAQEKPTDSQGTQKDEINFEIGGFGCVRG